MKAHIQICFDRIVDKGGLVLKNGSSFNYNTLEPKILKANGLKKLNEIFGTDYKEIDDMHKYMKASKTECALKIFETEELIVFPDYLLEAIKK
ncbi:hypothetical protein D3C76_1394730 [compost metagenome]